MSRDMKFMSFFIRLPTRPFSPGEELNLIFAEFFI